jgi:lysophospholipase L1-like esterase
MQKRLDQSLRQLRARGARVVVATMASTAPSRLGTVSEALQSKQDDTFARLNQLLLRFQARHPDDLTLVDLAGRVCPGGPPCPSEVDGLVLRPIDGGHYSPTGGVWVSEWLLPYIEGTGAAPAAGT